MKSRLRRLSIAAAATLSAVVAPTAYSKDNSTFIGDQQSAFSSGANASTRGYVGSDDRFQVAPLPPTRSRGYIGDEIRPTFATDQELDYPAQERLQTLPETSAAPSYSEDFSNRLRGDSSYFESMPCDTLGMAYRPSAPKHWMRAELLLWFPQARDTPPMGVVANPNQLPVLDPTVSPSAMPLGESFGNGLTPGFRGDVGRYFANGQFGVGGRVWVLGDDRDNLGFSGDGSDASFGVPFFNTNPDRLGEDAVLIGFAPNPLTPGVGSVGDAHVHSSTSLVAAELYTRLLLGQSQRHRLELISGYSHFNLRDRLHLDIDTVELPSAERTIFRDRFDTRNEFHGGQLGTELTLYRGPWSASSLTKVHLGNMSQWVSVDGYSSQQIIGPNSIVQQNEGLFARGNALGTQRRDEFAFVPEVNLRLGYQFRKHVSLHAGYSFLYWSNVAMAGDQMDRNQFVDSATLDDPGPGRYTSLKSSGYWVQGIDLGATLTF
ncbi:MAG: hypothetical protein EA381_18005 [Planctomycetaceae bacterium]|nr:MAG: hypothetical protein EA381_18005 [Planctomycetaceae bacterium]